MNAFRLLRALQDNLSAEMAPDGLLTVAAEATEAIEALGKQAPDKWGVALVWQGYNGPEDGESPDWQNNRFSAFVRVPVGLPAIPGNALHREITGGHDSVLERVEWVSLAVRRLRFTNADIEPRAPRLVRSTWYRKEDGHTIRVHELEFELVTALDVAVEDAVLTVA